MSEKEKEDLTSRVLQHGELVDYQEGAVVSRAIIKKQVGTVTLFAFDAGEGLSEHTAPFDALVHILDGGTKGSLDIQNQYFSLPDI